MATSYAKTPPRINPLMNRAQRLERMQRLSRWLDRRWQIPGTEWRIGLDGILGLVPGVGDTVSAGLSTWIIYEAHQLGAPWWLKLRMLWNMFIDWLIGLVPLVGDLFDINPTVRRWHSD